MNSLRSRVTAYVRVTHLFAVVVVSLASGGFAALALGGFGNVWRIVGIFSAMFLIQVAIGCSNEYFDRHLDAVAKPWRPIPAGAIPARSVVAIAIVTALAGLAISLTLGLVSGFIASLGLALGVSYNAGLKRTRLAWLPYVLALPLVPIWSFVAVGRSANHLLLLYPLGILAIIGIHLANTLPDIERDVAAGVSGFAHSLGRRGAFVVCVSALGATPVLMLLAQSVTPLRLEIFLPAAGIYSVLIVLGIAVYLGRRGGDRWLFHLYAPAIAILGTAWVASSAT
ncbi:MAG TPA: UbiA family prenyltransferase [Chloroflexota bacterium]|nr:UbiA family prenyltransferase [Chloroflexota bacterium]